MIEWIDGRECDRSSKPVSRPVSHCFLTASLIIKNMPKVNINHCVDCRNSSKLCVGNCTGFVINISFDLTNVIEQIAPAVISQHLSSGRSIVH